MNTQPETAAFLNGWGIYTVTVYGLGLFVVHPIIGVLAQAMEGQGVAQSVIAGATWVLFYLVLLAVSFLVYTWSVRRFVLGRSASAGLGAQAPHQA